MVGDFNGWDEKACPLKPRWDSSGIWEGFVPGVRPGALPDSFPFARRRGPEGRPLRPPLGGAARDGLDGLGEFSRLGRRPVDGRACRAEGPGEPPFDLRSASRFLEARCRRAVPVLARDGPSSGRVRRGDGLHPRGVDARDGAPLLRLLGIPGDRVFRPHEPVREPRGPDVPRRHPSQGGDRRDPGLGALPLPRRPPRVACGTSTGPTSSSTPTRGRASTRLERAAYSTTGGTRCGPSC